MAKRRTRRVLTLEEAQRAVRDVASQFGHYQCAVRAREMARLLGPDFDAAFERLTTSDGSDVIALAKEGIQVSANRVHVGVRVGSRIYDNLHHDGGAAAEWRAMFVTATDAPLIQQSRAIREFLGKIFLFDKFSRWAFGR